MHDADLDRANVFARTIAHDPDPELARVLGVARVDALGPAIPLPGILGLPLRWIADGPLASTLLQVLAAALADGREPADPYQAFARALTSRAGIHETTRLRAALGGPLAEALRALTAAESGQDGRGSRWSRVTGLGHLTDGCGPMASTHQSPSPAQAAALRAVALALTDGAAGGAEVAAGRTPTPCCGRSPPPSPWSRAGARASPRSASRSSSPSSSVRLVSLCRGMGELLLIRHGETAWSRTGQYGGRTDLPLTEAGAVGGPGAGPGAGLLPGDRPRSAAR